MPLALTSFYIADVLMCNYMYITCVYFVYCMYTERHFCSLYYRVNSCVGDQELHAYTIVLANKQCTSLY